MPQEVVVATQPLFFELLHELCYLELGERRDPHVYRLTIAMCGTLLRGPVEDSRPLSREAVAPLHPVHLDRSMEGASADGQPLQRIIDNGDKVMGGHVVDVQYDPPLQPISFGHGGGLRAELLLRKKRRPRTPEGTGPASKCPS